MRHIVFTLWHAGYHLCTTVFSFFNVSCSLLLFTSVSSVFEIYKLSVSLYLSFLLICTENYL
uniref:SDG123 n=1 Tax=Arundo donax TaxID=35708 RepID=A0A0A9FAE8_ARUDO